jgi:hypothetical protein
LTIKSKKDVFSYKKAIFSKKAAFFLFGLTDFLNANIQRITVFGKIFGTLFFSNLKFYYHAALHLCPSVGVTFL